MSLGADTEQFDLVFSSGEKFDARILSVVFENERISALPTWVIQLVSKTTLDESWVGRSVSLFWGEGQVVHGDVFRINEFPRNAYDEIRYQIFLVSPLHRLTVEIQQRVFSEQHLKSVFEEVLAPTNLQLLFSGEDPFCPWLHQRSVSSYDFFMELLQTHDLHFCLRFTDLEMQCYVFQEKHFPHLPSGTLQPDETECLQQTFGEISSWVLSTERQDLQVGQMILYEGNAYRLVAMSRRWSQSQSFNNHLRFQAEIHLQEALQPWKKQPKHTPIFSAKIESPVSDSVFIDQLGRYRFRLDNDTRKKPCALASPPSHKQLLHVGRNPASGGHFPLLADTQCVVVSDQQPWIMGALPSNTQRGPVNSSNELQHKIVTQRGHQLLLDNTPGQSQVLLSNVDGDELSWRSNGELRVSSQHYSLQVQVEKSLFWEGNSSAKLATFGTIKKTTRKNLAIKSMKNIHKNYAKQDIVVVSGRDLLGRVSKKKLEIFSPKRYNNFAVFDLMLQAKQHSLVMCSQQGDCKLTARQAVIGQAQEGLRVQTHQAQLSINNQGVRLMGQRIVFAAKTIFIKHGGFSSHHRRVKPMRNTHTHQKHPKLQSAIGVNLREDLENEYFASQAVADDPYKRSLLTASELQYLIQNGNTATLFIHGYNVDYGEFSVMHLDGIDGSGQARSLNVEMPIYRDELLIDDWACYNADHTPANPWVSAAYERICERYSHVKHDIQSDFSSMRKNTFNGTGTHQWWLHMEDNLNRAAGHEPAGDYENYTRIVNVMWQGNPKNPADYMAAVSMAERAGGLLIPLLEQLINKGLRVNIIAHSLGNLVLAKALDILGEVPVYHQAIDQAVFWEPAMPDTVFTPGEKDESIFSRYQCPLALKVLKRSTILFSEHDNVLGPVPAEKHLSEKWQQGGWPYVLIAEAVNWIDEHHFGNDIKSLYNIANMLGVPMHYLLGHANHREAFYQSWIAQHPRTLGGVSFSRSLDDQIAYFSRHYLLPFRGLSLVCGMLLHGVHQPVKDLKQFRSLAEMAMNGDLSPLAFVKNGFTQENGRLSWRDQSVEETAAIILTVLLSPEAQPRAAMGWRGPDFLSKAVSCPVNLCDQSDWLFSHSGMLRPNTDLLLSVYRGWVIGQHGIQQFGRYPVADLQPESVEDSDPSPFTDSRLTIPEKIAV